MLHIVPQPPALLQQFVMGLSNVFRRVKYLWSYFDRCAVDYVVTKGQVHNSMRLCVYYTRSSILFSRVLDEGSQSSSEVVLDT